MSVAPLPRDDVSEDGLLGNRVRLRQPRRGYRVSMDAVLLAATVDAPIGAQVLDVGAGVGGVGLCLLARRPDLRVVGIECQWHLVRLAQANAALNGAAERLRIVAASVFDHPAALAAAGLVANSLDHVVTNPPHHDSGTVPSPDPSQALADREDAVPLAGWIDFCLAALRPGGGLTLIHRADRLADCLTALSGRAGAIRVHPLWPGVGKPARRVLVAAVKGRRTPMQLLSGLVLHDARGHLSPEAEAVLRDGAALDRGLANASNAALKLADPFNSADPTG